MKEIAAIIISPNLKENMDGTLHQIIQDDMLSGDNVGELGATHHSYYGPRQRLRLKPSSYSDFWKRFCELVADNERSEKQKLSLAEVPSDITPVLGSFSFRFNGSGGQGCGD